MGQNGHTALHWAASKNSLEMAELLLGVGTSTDAKSSVRAGCSCLGAECVAVGQGGLTALHLC